MTDDYDDFVPDADLLPSTLAAEMESLAKAVALAKEEADVLAALPTRRLRARAARKGIVERRNGKIFRAIIEFGPEIKSARLAEICGVSCDTARDALLDMEDKGMVVRVKNSNSTAFLWSATTGTQ